MEDFHRFLGEGLFVIYVIVLIVAFVLSRRGRDVPPWLAGVAHGLLTIQIALGVILLLSGGLRGVHWLHPVVGLTAFLAVGFVPALMGRFRPSAGKASRFAVTAGVLAVLALAAQLIATMSRG